MEAGEIIIDTQLDTDGLTKGIKEMNKAMERCVDTVDKTSAAITDAFDGVSTGKARKEVEKLKEEFSRTNLAIEKQKAKVDELQRKYEALTSNDNKPASVVKIEKEMAALEKEAARTKGLLDEVYVELKKLDDASSFVHPIDQADFQKSTDQLLAQAEGLENKLYDLDARGQALGKTLNQIRMNPAITDEAKKLSGQISVETAKAEQLNSKMENLKNKIDNSSASTKNLAANTKAVGNQYDTMGNKAEKAANKASKSAKKSIKINNNLGKSISRVMGRLNSIITGALFFSAITIALTQLRNAFGIMLKSNDRLSKSLAAVKGNLLVAFAPIYEYLIPVLDALFGKLKVLTAYLAQFTSVLFGTTVEASKKAAEALYNQSKATDKASKSASKAAASYDQLNVINNDTSSDSSSDTAVTPDFNTQVMSGGLIGSLAEALRKGDWGEVGTTIGSAVNNMLSKVNTGKMKAGAKKFATNTANLINGFFGSVDWSTAGDKLSGSLNAMVAGVSTFFSSTDFSMIGSSISKFLQATIQGIDFNEIGKEISAVIKGAINLASGFITQTDWGALLINLASGFASLLSGLDVSSIITSMVNLVSGIIDATFDAISTILSNPQKLIEIFMALGKFIFDLNISIFKGLGQLFFNIFNSAWEFTKKAFNAGVAFAHFSGIREKIKSVFSNIGAWFSGIFGGAWSGIKNVWSAAKSFFSTIWTGIKSVFTPTFFTDIFSKAWEGVKTIWNKAGSFFGSVWSGIKSVFSVVTDWFRDVFTGAWKGVKSVFSAAGNLFVDIKNGITDFFRTTVNGLIKGINSVISVPFNGINSALKMIKDISIMGMKPFDGIISTISVPQIPYLASGAVIPGGKEFMAVLGDQPKGQTNIEAPLETIKQALREVQGEVNVYVYLEGETKGLFKVIRTEAINYKNKTGDPAFD